MGSRISPRAALAIATVATLVMVIADDSIGAVGIVIAVTVSTLALVTLLNRERDGHPLPIGAVALAGGVVLLAAIIVGPHDSNDLWAYTMYGRILTVHHASPWAFAPAHFPHDPFLLRVASGWRHTTSIYGPAFGILAAGITKLGGDTAIAVRMLFTSTFALAAAGAGFIVFRRTRSSTAAALVILHPAIAIAGIAGGHNDIIVGLGLLGAVVFAQDDRPVASGICAALATLVKLTGGIGIIALGCWALAHRGRRWSAVFAATSLGLVVLAYLPLGTTGFSAFVENRWSLSRASAWQFPRLLTGLDHRHSAINFGLPQTDTQLLITLGTVVMVGATIWIAVRLRRRTDPSIPVGAALGSYLVFAPYVLPWYPAWVIPTLALTPRAPIARLLALQGAALVIVYELKTQSLSGWLASTVWWISVLASVTLGACFLRAVRAKEPQPVLVSA